MAPTASPPRPVTDPDPLDSPWQSPPPDVEVPISPEDARRRAAAAVANHVEEQLNIGRSLYCIVRDHQVSRHIGGFDGRALPRTCLGADGSAGR